MATSASTIKTAIETILGGIATEPKFRPAYEGESLIDLSSLSGNERAFHVWDESWEVGEATTPAESEIREEFLIVILYPGIANWINLDSQIRDDAQKIRAAMDNQANWPSDVVHMQVARGEKPDKNKERDRALLGLIVEVRFIESNT